MALKLVLKMKEFDDHDWNTFAGAESFPNGDPPLLGWLGDHPFVVDATGISLFYFDDMLDDENMEVGYLLELPTKAVSVAVLEKLVGLVINEGTLEEFGFVKN